MAITIPALPVSDYSLSYLSNATVLTPTFGGQHQRVNRLGDRFSLSLRIDPLAYRQAAAVIADLNAGLSQTVIVKVPQEFAVGTPGSPTVASAGQSGMALAVKDLSSGYAFKKGQFVTVVSGGRRYLHQITANVTATGTTATLPIQPMLRVSPAISDPVQVTAPEIEGFLTGESHDWTVSRLSSVGLTISVQEAA